MHVIELFLPLRSNDGVPFDRALFATVRRELTDRFGGMTAYMRSPAVGLWEDDDGDVCRDDIVRFEVMADPLDRDWWRAYRTDLQRRFQQDEILVRATMASRL